MSCLDVMYQVYGPPQPYFAAAYTPYHQVSVSPRAGTLETDGAPLLPGAPPAPWGPGHLRTGPGRPTSGGSPGDAGIAGAATRQVELTPSLSTCSLGKAAKPC